MTAREYQPVGLLAWDPTAVMAGLWDDDEDEDVACVRDGVLRVPVRGGMSEGSWWGCAYSHIREELAEARGIIGLKAVVLEIDSPGGEVSGVQETVAAIRATDAVVPVYAFVKGTAASAAYWLAAACRRIVAVETTRVGCVGAVVSLVDMRGLAEKLGAKYYRFTSDRTPLKAPEPGSDEFSAEAQATVDAMGDAFLADLGRMRGPRGDLDAVAAHYQGGRILAGAAALEAGWVDAILTSQPSGPDAWLMTGGAPPQAARPAPSFQFPMVRRAAAATKEEGSMPNENNGGGVVALTAEAHTELLAQLAAHAERVTAAEARATAAEARLSDVQTQRNDAETRIAALEAQAMVQAQREAAREVADAVSAAVAAGKVAPGDTERHRAFAAKYGIEALRASLGNIPEGAAGPRRALASGQQMPEDGGDKTAMARQLIAKARETGKPFAEMAKEMGVAL